MDTSDRSEAFDARFERAAESLGRGRPGYPSELYERILAAGGGGRFGTALDLGCGAGHSLAGLFQIAEVVQALEPGEELRTLAQRAFPAASISGATAEQTALPDASVDLVTIATAFTWMEHASVLCEVRRVLKRGGTLAIYAYGFPMAEEAAGAVLERHLGEHWDAHRAERLRNPIDVGDCVERSGLFAQVESFVVPHWIVHTPETLAEFFESTSFVSAFLKTHVDPSRYLAEFIDELRAAAGDRFEVEFSLQVTVARI